VIRLGAPLLLLTCGLAGCSGLLHSDTRPEQTYYLRGAAPSTDSSGPVGASLRIGRPIAAPGLESPHIVLLQADRRMDFYSASRWPGPVPEMVESLAVESLRASGQWKSVEDSTSPFPSDYLLSITVRHFEADYTSGAAAPQVRVAFDCLLGRREGREVIASFVAEGSAQATANRLGDVVAAFDTASQAALASMADRALEAVRAQKVEAPVPSMTR
jgi:ABC-type uncharacterized transport system auxiliary subunit